MGSPSYLSITTQMNNFAVTGLQVDADSHLIYGIIPQDSRSISITTNTIPMHPHGIFPTSENPNQLMNFCAPNSNSFSYPSLVEFQKTASFSNNTTTSSTSVTSPVGYLFDNTLLYVACNEFGFNPVAQKTGDVFFTDVTDSGKGHHRYIPPSLINWIVSTRMKVIGFMMDGYPIVAPFLVMDNITKSVRVIQTSDLNKYHGLKGTFNFTLPSGLSNTMKSMVTSTPVVSQNMSYDFVYVATFDFPYTISAFYGNPL